MKTTISTLILFSLFLLKAQTQECQISIGSDTITCGYSYTLQAAPFGGNWDLICESSAGQVDFFEINDSLTSATVSACGAYFFVYTYLETDSLLILDSIILDNVLVIDSSYVQDTLCLLRDTLQIDFQNPSNTEFNLFISTTITFPEFDCPEGDTINCGNSSLSSVPPDPLWTFYTSALCNASVVEVATMDTSCVVDQITFSSTNTSGAVSDTFSIYQSAFLQQDPISGAIITNNYAAVMDSISSRVQVAAEAFCPVSGSCQISLPECIDTIRDTIETILPIRLQGNWLFSPDEDPLMPLTDTTQFVQDDSSYLMIALPSASNYEANFFLYQIDYMGDTIPTATLPGLRLQWDEEWGLDTLVDITERLIDTCCGGALRVNREFLNEVSPPNYNCSPYPVIFLEELKVFQSFASCDTASYQVRLVATGGRAPYSFVGLTGTVNDTIFISDAIPIGTSYTVLVTDADGCVKQIEGDACPCVDVNTGAPDAIALLCEQECTTLAGQVSIAVGSIENLTFSWEELDNGAIFEDSIFTACDTGWYAFQVEDSVSGCIASTLTRLDREELVADAGIGTTLDCFQEEIQLGGPNLSMGAGVLYEWVGPGIDSSNMNQAQPVVSIGGTYTLYLSLEGQNCRDTGTVVIEEDLSILIADAGLDRTLGCGIDNHVWLGGDSTSTGENITYLWTAPGLSDAEINSQYVTTNEPGEFILLVENTSTGCTASDTVNVFVFPGINFDAEVTGISCFNLPGGRVNITNIEGGEPPYIFSWNGVGFTNVIPMSNVPSGTHTITVRDRMGCTGTQTVMVPLQGPIPTADIEEEYHYCVDADITLDLSVLDYDFPVTYSWSTGSNEPIEVIDTAGTYTAIIQSACEALRYEFTVINDAEIPTLLKDIAIPNAFTPDGDGANDEFKPIITSEFIEEYSLLIYNRWGQKVFESNDPDLGWNGEFKGRQSPAEIYLWSLRTQFLLCEDSLVPFDLKGDLYLVR